MNDTETMVQAALQAKIIQALKSAPEAIDAMIEAALSKPVDESTGHPDRGYGKKVPFLEYLTGQTIRHAAEAGVRKVVAEMQDDIDSAIRKRLTADDVAEQLVKTALGVVKEDWRLNVNFAKEDK